MLLCTTELINEKTLKKNDNLLSRYKIARGRKTYSWQTYEIKVLYSYVLDKQ